MNIACRTLALRPLVALGVALLLGACSDNKADDDADAGQVAADQNTGWTMSGMQDTPGMGGNGMMEQMQAHLRLVDGVSADSMQVMMPTHRQLVTNMLAQFDTDVRGMGMTSDTAWNATADSLRQDLMRMSGMTGAEHHQFMAGHVARLRRYMESHRTMMGSMKR